VLAVDASRRGCIFAPLLAAQLFVQRVINLLPRAILSPLAEVVEDGLVRGKVAREVAPGAAVFVHIENGIHDFAHVGSAPIAAGARWRDKRLDDIPLGIGEVACVMLAVLLAHGWRGGNRGGCG